MDKNERKRKWRKKKKAALLGIPVDSVVDGRGRHGNHARSSKHPRWNGDLSRSDGYRLVRVGKNHPLAHPNGYALEHMVVAASAYGLEAIRGMVVHHINGDITDNRIENLQMLTSSDHMRLHMKLRTAKKQISGDSNTGEESA